MPMDDMYIQSVVQKFAAKHKRFKEVEAKFGKYKAEFENTMLEYFDSVCQGKKSITFNVGNELAPNGTVRVTKVEKTSIEWDTDKLKKKLPKLALKKVFKKRYVITDYASLVRYLKSIGADPSVFKLYVTSEEVFDADAIESLSNTGEIGINNIKGCYFVKCQKPYFTVTIK